MNGQRGVALILALLATSFLSAIGLGLAVVVFMDRLASGNVRAAAGLANAADAGLELAAHHLARADWHAVLGGGEQASFADGEPAGVRAIPGGGALDLSAETNTLNCGRASSCTAAQMDEATDDRPWGVNNPRWRLYAYGAFESLPALARPTSCYLAVWVADDVSEVDGDPFADGELEGRGVLRARAVAFGPLGARRAVEAELARVCFGVADEEICQPGIRVQSWKEVRQLVP
jgi:hypothetical protein